MKLVISQRFSHGKAKYRWYFKEDSVLGKILARGSVYHNSPEESINAFLNFIKEASKPYATFLDGTGYITKTEGGEIVKVIINLKAIQIDTTEIEDLMVIKNQLAVIDNEYQNLTLDTPEWVTDKLGEVSREINSRVTAELTLKLKQAKSRRAAFKTNVEKRDDLDAEIKALESKLG